MGCRWGQNSKYFHACVQHKRSKLFIHQINDHGGHKLSSPIEIRKESEVFFSNLYRKERLQIDTDLLNVIPHLVTEEDNRALIAPFDEAEIWGTVQTIDHDSTTGPDGFTGGFFQS